MSSAHQLEDLTVGATQPGADDGAAVPAVPGVPAVPAVPAVRHVLTIAELGTEAIKRLLGLADTFAEVLRRSNNKVPALRGKTVASLFFEDSTRTRLSFETAARRLSADTMTFSVSTSSTKKGESLLDTAATIGAMGVDAVVVRHSAAGAAHRLAAWAAAGYFRASVLNGGDGWHAHPTQALLDVYTLLEAGIGDRASASPLAGVRVGIVGDVVHSRVARSDAAALSALGATVVFVGPPTLIPPTVEGWSLGPEIEIEHDFDAALPRLDAVQMLRIQRERINEALFPSEREYVVRYGLDERRLAALPNHAPVMHPGPMNRGVEMTPGVADHPRAVIRDQVRNGVAVRMAVLFDLLGGEL